MTSKEKVKGKWLDAEISTAFATQPDMSRKWMYCVMSPLKAAATCRMRNSVMNLGSWKFTKAQAWKSAAEEVANG